MNNEIIDKNLKLIYESPRDYTPYFDFIDIKINPQKKILAKEMDSKGLIKLQGEFCYKTDFGKKVMDEGGWLQYIENNQRHILTKEDLGIKENKSGISNSFKGANIGYVIQESDLSKARINNTPNEPTKTPLRKGLLRRMASNPWTLLIVGAIISAILNADAVMGFINNTINKIKTP